MIIFLSDRLPRHKLSMAFSTRNPVVGDDAGLVTFLDFNCIRLPRFPTYIAVLSLKLPSVHFPKT